MSYSKSFKQICFYRLIWYCRRRYLCKCVTRLIDYFLDEGFEPGSQRAAALAGMAGRGLLLYFADRGVINQRVHWKILFIQRYEVYITVFTEMARVFANQAVVENG